MHADEEASRTLTGAGLVGMALANRAGLVHTTRANQGDLAALLAAYQAAQGNPFAKSRAVNEAFAGQHGGFQAGVLNALTDPANLLGPAGKAAEVARLGKLAEVLRAADAVQNLPGEALGKVAAPVAGRLLAGLADRQAAREALTTASEKVTGKAGGLPKQLIPKVGGVRQYGPVPPPPRAMLADLPAPAPPPLRDFFPLEAVTPGQEAAAKAATYGPLDHPVGIPQSAPPDLPGYQGQTRREALGALTSDEIDRLVNIAYPVEKAQANAILAHPDPTELADAAINRITAPDTSGRPLAARLQQLHPDLAEKIAFLPEPEGVATLADAPLSNVDMPPAITDPAGRAAWQARYVGQSQAGTDILAAGDKVAGGDLTQADLNALSPQERMAALRKLAAEPAAPAPGSNEQRVIGMAALKGGTPTLGEIQREFKVGAAEALRLQDIASGAKPTSGGDLAAGGGGFGLVPARLGTTLAGAGVGTGVGGLAGGGLGLAAGHRDDQLKEDVAAGAGLGALAGGSVGSVSPEIAAYARQFAAQAGPGLAEKLEGSYLTDPEMIGDVLTVMKRAQGEEGLAAGSVSGPRDWWPAFANYWKRQAVNTPKQLPQDAAQRTLTLEGAGLRQEFPGYGHQAIQQWQKRLSAERVGRVSTVDNPVVAMFRALGQEKLLGDLPSIDGIDYGGSLETQGKRFGPVGRTVAGGLIGLASGVKKVNPISPVLGMARGFLDPAIDAGIRHANGIQHDAARYAMRESAMPRDFPALADRFLGELADRGVDVAPLAAKGGFFAPEEVAALAGPDAGKVWGQRAEELIRAQGNRIAFLNGDFRESSRLPGEKWFTKAVPFSSWAIHYAPVLAEIAARHPVATIHVLRELDREKAEAAAQGKQAYQSGITIGDKTPLVGLAARVRNGGGAGTLTMNPIGSLVPFSDIGGGGQPLPEDATGYQRLTDLTGRVGFQPNPAIQSLAYVTGQGRAPSSLSRTAGLEGLADTAPVLVRALLRGTGNPDLADRVPDLALPGGRTILDAVRGVVAPAVEQAGLPTTGGGPSDPAVRRYEELAQERTGKSLYDPSNRRLLETMGDTDNPLWQQAILQSRAAGAAGNAASLTSPVQTTAQTATGAQRQAAAKPAYSIYQIRNAPAAQRAAMMAANDRAGSNYTNLGDSDRKWLLTYRWEREHDRLRRDAPALYAQRLKDYKASLK